jgi:hypothetical protein
MDALPGGPAMAAVMDQIAHDEATRATTAELAQFLQDLLGQKLTAAMVGLQDPKAVGAWARGERCPHTSTEKSLRHAYRIARLLKQVESPQTIRAWFVGMNPLLDDEAPAELLSKEPVRVLQAARAFLAGG